MPGYLVDDTRKVTTHRLKEMKAEGKKIAMLTSYDFTTAKIVDEAGNADVFEPPCQGVCQRYGQRHEAFRLAAHKLPISTKFIQRGDQHEG